MVKVDITIIGGGVVGCAIAYELSKFYPEREIVLLEKNPGLGEEQSSRNSGVIHSGIYYDNAPLKRKFCIEGNKLLYSFCQQYNIPCVKTGKFIVATNDAEDKIVDKYLKNALLNNLDGVKKVTAKEVKEKEPNVNVKTALWCPDTGIIDVPTYIHTLAKLAKQHKVEILTQAKVVKILPINDSFEITVEYKNKIFETFKSNIVINSAGLYSDEIAKMVNPNVKFEIVPIRGEYYRFDSSSRKEINVFGTNIYPVGEWYHVDDKEYFVLGVHLTPTFELTQDNKKIVGRYILVGPNSKYVKNKTDYETGREGPEYFVKQINKFFPNLTASDLQKDYAGIRAKLKHTDDFVIQKDTLYPNMINLIGIDSPGLTSSLAIAKYVRELVMTN